MNNIKIYKAGNDILVSRKASSKLFYEFLIWIPSINKWGHLGYDDYEKNIKHFHGSSIEKYIGALPAAIPDGKIESQFELLYPDNEMYE